MPVDASLLLGQHVEEGLWVAGPQTQALVMLSGAGLQTLPGGGCESGACPSWKGPAQLEAVVSVVPGLGHGVGFCLIRAWMTRVTQVQLLGLLAETTDPVFLLPGVL